MGGTAVVYTYGAAMVVIVHTTSLCKDSMVMVTVVMHMWGIVW